MQRSGRPRRQARPWPEKGAVKSHHCVGLRFRAIQMCSIDHERRRARGRCSHAPSAVVDVLGREHRDRNSPIVIPVPHDTEPIEQRHPRGRARPTACCRHRCPSEIMVSVRGLYCMFIRMTSAPLCLNLLHAIVERRPGNFPGRCPRMASTVPVCHTTKSGFAVDQHFSVLSCHVGCGLPRLCSIDSDR